MKKYFPLTLIGFSCLLQGHSNKLTAVETKFSVAVEYSKGKLQENINYDGQFSALDIAGGHTLKGPVKHTQKYATLGPKAKLEAILDNQIYLAASFSHGWLISKVSEKITADQVKYDDALAKLMPLPFKTFGLNHSSKERKHGHLCNIETVIGYRWQATPLCTVTPYVGLNQHILQINKYQNFSELGPNPAKQKIRWRGPLFGFKVDWALSEQCTLSTGIEYHLIKGKNSFKNSNAGKRYIANGKHRGRGILLDVELNHVVETNWQITAGYQFSHRRMHIANRGPFYSSYTASTAQIKNKVSEKNHQFNIGLTYSF